MHFTDEELDCFLGWDYCRLLCYEDSFGVRVCAFLLVIELGYSKEDIFG